MKQNLYKNYNALIYREIIVSELISINNGKFWNGPKKIWTIHDSITHK